MWSRANLKQRGKNAFTRNYVQCVLVALIATIVLGATIKASGNSDNNVANIIQELRLTLRYAPNLFSTKGGLIALIIQIFIANILEIGCCQFFIRNSAGASSLNNVISGFQDRYGRNVLAMFLTRLYVALWSLLFVIPGIVKAYSYMLVPYILADNPDISRGDALTFSKTLMYGHKMDAFVLDLSFLGWHILNVFTVGLLGVFYVNPYIYATKAELYNTLKGNRFIDAAQ